MHAMGSLPPKGAEARKAAKVMQGELAGCCCGHQAAQDEEGREEEFLGQKKANQIPSITTKNAKC